MRECLSEYNGNFHYALGKVGQLPIFNEDLFKSNLIPPHFCRSDLYLCGKYNIMSFVHLHTHTKYSIMDGQSSIENLFNRAEELGMSGLAITDHGNMYGVKEFFNFAQKHPTVKPIIGCEIYLTCHYDHRLKDKEHEEYYHLILLAKNYNGYRNLMKIVSIGHIEGMYNGKPRVSHQVVEKYAGDLICCSACIAGEVPRKLIAGDMEAAEKAVEWHRKVFGEDYYLEVQLHKPEVPGRSLEMYEKQLVVNEGIFRIAEKTGIKVIATNDVHFVSKEDGPAHDRLICLTTNANLDAQDGKRYTRQEYLKSEEEMAALFSGHPEVIDNTLEILDKVEKYSIDRELVLPIFKIDTDFLKEIDKYLVRYKDVIDAGRCDKNGNDRGIEFTHSMAYLCHLCYEGAQRRYGTLTSEQEERIDFELKTISRMGFPDYFLIVQDLVAAARRMGVLVGPGRGSSPGSIVVYCLGITNIDPIKYGLLFEHFMNPDRISMPDIDIDFDDDGRYKVFKYLEDTYGGNRISRVTIFGTTSANMSIKEGFIRQAGVHACAMIMGRDDLTGHIPISIATDKAIGEDVRVSQYEARFVEEVGMLKMDFVGLKVLSIIKECLERVRERHGIEIDIEAIPIDDPETYKLYSRGDTAGVFQFESEGMKQWLRKLQPSRFEDLIAMNALYHPRSMHGKFIEGSTKNGHPKAILDKIWRDWQNNAECATIKSHAVCYAWISYQTAYLKAHYPAEFEAAKLSKDHDK